MDEPGLPGHRSRGMAALLLAALAGPGCDSIFGSSARPSTVVIAPAAVTFDAVGETLSLSAVVRDQNDRVMADVPVTWTSSNPHAVQVTEGGVVTAVRNGLSQITATAGRAMATVPATLTQQATSLEGVEGDGQSAAAGTELEGALVVEAHDRLGTPVTGADVAFVVVEGGGTVNPIKIATGPDGRASVTWTLGILAGAPQRARASLTASPNVAVEFEATAVPGPPAVVTAIDGDLQTGEVDRPLPQAVEVLVLDGHNNPVPGVTVTFAPRPGSGSASPSQVDTDASGHAAAQWTLGPAEGTHTLVARIAAGAEARFTATATATPPPGSFSIELQFTEPPSPSQLQAFRSAAARWESIITEGLTPVHVAIDAATCGPSSPAIDRVVDDLLIFVTLESIDGPGGALGSAFPCYLRLADSLTIVGGMRFDTDDLPALEAMGLLEDVILHEMGHVLGIGTLWDFFGSLRNRSLPDAIGADTHFDGPAAIDAFDAIGGAGYDGGAKVPVENAQGGQGTRDVHWRQSVFADELMTGFLTGGTNPLSLVTVASLADLGYRVDPGAADPFSLDLALRMPALGPLLHLEHAPHEVPIRLLDRRGRHVGVLRR